MFKGGATFKMCGFFAFFKYGRQAWEHKNVPLTLISFIRSYLREKATKIVISQ